MRTDMTGGWVWLSGPVLVARSIIKITNRANNKSVFCERLEIDDNFTREYNQPPRIDINPSEETVVINAWYRKRLGGLATTTFHDLKIIEANDWWGKIRANTGHPQVVVRLGTWLGVISVALGFIGVLLGVLSIYLASK